MATAVRARCVAALTAWWRVKAKPSGSPSNRCSDKAGTRDAAGAGLLDEQASRCSRPRARRSGARRRQTGQRADHRTAAAPQADAPQLGTGQAAHGVADASASSSGRLSRRCIAANLAAREALPSKRATLHPARRGGSPRPSPRARHRRCRVEARHQAEPWRPVASRDTWLKRPASTRGIATRVCAAVGRGAVDRARPEQCDLLVDEAGRTLRTESLRVTALARWPRQGGWRRAPAARAAAAGDKNCNAARSLQQRGQLVSLEVCRKRLATTRSKRGQADGRSPLEHAAVTVRTSQPGWKTRARLEVDQRTRRAG